MKNFILFILIIFLITNLNARGEELEFVSFRFKSCRCKSLNESVVAVRYCRVKAYSRTVATLNIVIDILKTLRGPIWVETQIKYKFNVIYRQIYPTVKFEFCSIMKNKGGGMEKLVNFLISLFRESVPQLFHECPYKVGLLNMTNITVTENNFPASKVVPSGMWKFILTMSLNTSKFYYEEFEVETKSSMKDFF
jgi:hypothetical protein